MANCKHKHITITSKAFKHYEFPKGFLEEQETSDFDIDKFLTTVHEEDEEIYCDDCNTYLQ